MSKRKDYDPACAALAQYFLDNEPDWPQTEDAIKDLAQTIQTAVEDWFSARLYESQRDDAPHV